MPAAGPNPYESPQVPGGYEPDLPAGIGVWCDDRFLVVHPSAILPPICIKTGLPAEHTLPFTLHRSFVLDRATRRLQLQLPISSEGFRQLRSSRRRNVGIAAVALLLFVLSMLILSDDFIVRLLRYAAFMFVCVAVSSTILNWRPLQFVRARKPYFWLAGASDRFLAQLPPWTFG